MVFLLGKLLWLLAVFSHGMLREHGGQAAIAAIVLVKVIRCIRYGAKELTKCHDRIFIVLKQINLGHQTSKSDFSG